MKKYRMTLSQAIMTLGGLMVPSDLVNSVEIAEALRMAMAALNMQVNIGQLITDIKDDFKPEDSYSATLVLDMLNDGYMLSEENLVSTVEEVI